MSFGEIGRFGTNMWARMDISNVGFRCFEPARELIDHGPELKQELAVNC